MVEQRQHAHAKCGIRGEVVAKVTEAEKDVILKLNKRKAALKELWFASVSATPEDIGPIYERLVADLGETCCLYDKWWVDMRDKYGWPMNRHVEIDFASCEVYMR